MENAKKFRSKIDVRNIISDHWATIVNANTGSPDKADIAVFMALPIAFAIIMLYFKALMSDAVIGGVISGLSIFVGLLFNVLVVIFDIVKRDSYVSIKNEILKQSLTNISFSILISLLCIITSVISLIKIKYIQEAGNALTYVLLSEFVFCLLMILKRMYRLLMNEFKVLPDKVSN
jgi:hypothetical protein